MFPSAVNQFVLIVLRVLTSVACEQKSLGQLTANKKFWRIRSQLSKTSQSTLDNIFKCTGDQNIPNDKFNSNLLGWFKAYCMKEVYHIRLQYAKSLRGLDCLLQSIISRPKYTRTQGSILFTVFQGQQICRMPYGRMGSQRGVVSVEVASVESPGQLVLKVAGVVFAVSRVFYFVAILIDCAACANDRFH